MCKENFYPILSQYFCEKEKKSCKSNFLVKVDFKETYLTKGIKYTITWCFIGCLMNVIYEKVVLPHIFLQGLISSYICTCSGGVRGQGAMA